MQSCHSTRLSRTCGVKCAIGHVKMNNRALGGNSAVEGIRLKLNIREATTLTPKTIEYISLVYDNNSFSSEAMTVSKKLSGVVLVTTISVIE